MSCYRKRLTAYEKMVSVRLHLTKSDVLSEEPVPEDDAGGYLLHSLSVAVRLLPFVGRAGRTIIVVTFYVFRGTEQGG